MRWPEITLALFPSEKEESINSFNPVFLQFHSALFGFGAALLFLCLGLRGGGLMGCSSKPTKRRGAFGSRKARHICISKYMQCT